MMKKRMTPTEKLSIIKSQANFLMEELEELIRELPSKGDVESECQRLCLLNRLSDLEKTFNGLEESDLIED